jgi:hypothetical protein
MKRRKGIKEQRRLKRKKEKEKKVKRRCMK